MSRFVRLLPFAAGRRTYSFFSSKPGGGRYFNSAKPPKVVATSAGPGTSKASVDPPSPTSEVSEAKEDYSSQASQVSPPASDNGLSPGAQFASLPPHPMLKPHEFKLHHFFSLHRPLLLINQPTSTLFESLPATSTAPPIQGTIDNPPEASPEADADAARLLSRALVMNRVGSAVDWNLTLSRLGHVSETEPLPQDLSASSSDEVHMDSTKRKRRRKMKKHKLKKRRRLQRFERLKMGK